MVPLIPIPNKLAKLIVPFDGTVTDTRAQPGDRVSAGEAAFRVEDLSKLLIDLDVSEIDLNSVSVGQVVTVSFDAIQRLSSRAARVKQQPRVMHCMRHHFNFTLTLPASSTPI
ncbi:MAG: efflux RND transporter periplasmic adaptor subunit [Anaerolineales bacterium]|jgi:HlyD family secretion protein